MNKSKVILSAFALFTGSFAVAQTVTVELTGATAFRAAALDTIEALYNSELPGPGWTVVHNEGPGDLNGSDVATFYGKFPGIPGITVIRTSFSGSLGGLDSITNGTPTNDGYFTYADAVASHPIVAGVGTIVDSYAGPTDNAPGASDYSFSDVSISSTPFDASLVGPSANSPAGVVVFTVMANAGASSNLVNAGLTTQSLRALLTNGAQPMSFIAGDETLAPDGNPATAEEWVYWFGRNDESGTRTTYMTESQLGAAFVVNQYLDITRTATTVDLIELSGPYGSGPTGDSTNPNNISTVWGNLNILGNGGYDSGGDLRGAFARDTGTFTQVQVPLFLGGDPTVEANYLKIDQANAAGADTRDVNLVTWISIGDAASSKVPGREILPFNGVRLDGFAATDTLSVSDIDKITSGAYTAWGAQQFYYKAGTSGDALTVFNTILGAIGANIGNAGIPVADMNAARVVDGGTVSSNFIP